MMNDPWWRQMARGTICVAGLMSACTAPGRGVQARVPGAPSAARSAAVSAGTASTAQTERRAPPARATAGPARISRPVH